MSAKMMSRARPVAARLDRPIDLQLTDVQALPYADGSFDTVTATCVLSSVADPIAGLREVARVVRPDGQMLLLDHVRPRNPVLGWLADRIAPVIPRLMAPRSTGEPTTTSPPPASTSSRSVVGECGERSTPAPSRDRLSWLITCPCGRMRRCVSA